MKFGCCTSADNYDLLVKCGYDFIELSGHEVYFMPEDKWQELLKKVDAAGVPCIGFNSYCQDRPAIVGDNFDEEEARSYAAKLLDRGVEIGIKNVGIGAPTARRLPEGYPADKADAQCRRFLEITCEEAAKRGINVLFEAVHSHMCNYATRTEDAVNMVEALDIDNLFMVLDFYHMEAMGEDRLDFDRCVPYMRHLHFSTCEENYGRKYPSEADFDILQKIMKKLAKVGYDGTLSIEAGTADYLTDAARALAILKKAAQKKVVLAGAGTMGASLAQVYSQAGWVTVLHNRSESGLERAKKLIEVNQQTLVTEGLLTADQSEAVKSNIIMTTDKECYRDADLVVESIAENMEMKQHFWAEISELVPEDALLATNTSGLHITEIATACKNPERFMGQHWLNPPHLLPLCEIVVGEKTAKENVEKMRALVSSLGKMPVVVKDINGFIINRIQFAVLREALHIVESGAASFEDIDTVLKGGLGLRYAALGPFGVADFGGLDVFNRINSYLNAELCDSKKGSELLQGIVDSGKLGVKSGAGFYDYSGDKADEAIRERDRMYIELAKVLYFNK